MKKISIYLFSTLVGLLSVEPAMAVPLRLDNMQLKAASYTVNKEQRAERAQKDPAMPKVENFCRKMTGFRMGSAYHITVTDRLAPAPKAQNKFYSIVGNAEPKNPKAPTISYKCRVQLKADGALELTEFKLFEVEEASQVKNTEKSPHPNSK